MRPLAIDLFTGLHGWAEGLVAEGYDVVGYDLEDMCGQFGQPRPEHVQIVIQDVLTLHGAQFKDVALIVASPPCTEFSYLAMPWTRGKQIARALRGSDVFPVGYTGSRTIEDLNRLFHACFRIQREACIAAGRHIPLVVENVRGAQPWVGRARYNFGSFYLWGDVPALMPRAMKASKVPGFRFDGSGKTFQTASVQHTGVKAPGMNWSDPEKRGQDFTRLAGKHAMEGVKVPNDGTGRRTAPGKGARFTSKDCGIEAVAEGRKGAGAEHSGVKIGGDWFSDPNSTCRRHGSKSKGRKAASAMIAKIPEALSRHIAAVYRP